MGSDSSLSQKASPTSPITAEDKGLDHWELTTSSVLKVTIKSLSSKAMAFIWYNKQHHREVDVLLSSLYLNGHTLGFHPQTQK